MKEQYNASNEVTIIYHISNREINNKNMIYILHENFVNENKDNCKMIINGKCEELSSTITINPIKRKIMIKLKQIKPIKDMSYMFYECKLLDEIYNFSNWKTDEVTNLSYLFYGCENLRSVSDISKWNTSNVINMSYMFYNCKSFFYENCFSDISKWNTSNVKDMSYMFSYVNKIDILPDISKWDTSNVINMEGMFLECTTLKVLPDISKWNISNVQKLDKLFII